MKQVRFLLSEKPYALVVLSTFILIKIRFIENNFPLTIIDIQGVSG